MTWPKNAVLSLIEAYKDHPCLYSIRHLNYRNKIARRKAFETIYDKLQHIIPNVSFQELKMKVKSLRSTFIMEHRKFSALVLNGAESYSPNLWYYDRLLFLADPVPNWQVLKTTNGQILSNNSRHRPNILRERKTNNNKPLETAAAVELKTEEINDDILQTHELKNDILQSNEIEDDILQSNELIEMINKSCSPDEERKDDKQEEFNDSEVNMEFENSPQSISCISPKISIPPVDDNLHINLKIDEAKQHVDMDNAECTKQIQAFCNFIGSSLHMIKNSKAQMAVQRQITRLLYDALDNM